MQRKNYRIIVVILAMVVWGCTATSTRKVDVVEKVDHLAPEENLAVQVVSGAIMLQVIAGDHFTSYELKDVVEGSILGNKCRVTPQTFVDVSERGNYYYAVSKNDYFKPFVLNNRDDLQRLLCGVKFSKEDLRVDSTFIEYRNGKVDYMGLNGSERPALTAIPMVNIYAPNFRRKTLRLDSFADDFLSLRYMDERGTPNGYDSVGNPVAVPPEVNERIYEFDLQESKILDVQGARIEIVEARPDKIIYKIHQKMNPN